MTFEDHHSAFLILGSLAVRNANNETIHIQRLKHRQLLAALLLRANTPTPVEHLIEALWDDAPPPSAEQNIKTYIHALRKLLSPGDPRSAPIETQTNAYLITAGPEDLDLLAFQERLQQGRQASWHNEPQTAYHYFTQALGLWRGETLSNAKGSRPLNDAATRLTQEHLALLEETAEIGLSLARYDEVVSALRAPATTYPSRERLWGQLMLGLYGTGDRPAALEAYQRLRKALREETGLDPSQPIQDLHQRILTSSNLPDPTSRPGSAHLTQTSRSTPVPRQLPRDPTDFVGRVEELVQLRALLCPWDGSRPHHVIAITGPPGAGKSTLAIRAAHQARNHFPGGHLYANLYGATPGIKQLEPLDVLGRFLRDLGTPPYAIPTNLDEATSLWRSLLDGKNVLIVLDDATDPAQVRPLLSVPRGNTVLVTSRSTFVLVDDCVHVQIGRMRRVEASAMLAKLAGAERIAANTWATTRLIELCGSLPLAVGIAGARLASRPQWDVADLVERLQDERRRLHELEMGDLAVRSSLAVSYDLLAASDHPLDRTAARALRALGVLQVADVTSHIVAALLDAPADMAERAMERLVDAHLAETNETGRYRLHDLIRLFASEQAVRQQTQEARNAALDRALSCYVATTRLAVKLAGYPRTVLTEVDINANPIPLASKEEAHQWLDREQANLLAAASQAMAAPEQQTARLGVALTCSLFWHLHHANLHMHILSSSRQCLTVGQRLDDRGIQANAHSHMARALSLAHRSEEAMPHLHKQLALCRELSDLHGEQRALGALARDYLELNQYEEAITCAEAQWKAAKAIGHKSGEHFAATVIGAAYRGLRQFDRALAVLGEALDQTRRDGNVYQETSVRENLGEVHLDLGDPASAKTWYETALACADAAKVSVAEPYLLLGLARSCRLLGQIDQAATYLARSITTARATGNEALRKQLAEEEDLLSARGEPMAALGEVMTP
ncbi:BTAD domain-containing putative transcriptional regulator [Streptosporangium sp. NPDC000396]|uniref:AfsR/SARP family transcriptional regulator n=1 Tax=Streptosporangium sp. NPDC000396 TaxID=3366185 RepID=UPI003692D189